MKNDLENLSLKERMALLTGDGFWHSNGLDGRLCRMHLSDGPHGLRKQDDGKSVYDSIPATCFPTASALACSFDTDLVRMVGESIGKEAFNEKVSVLLGPGVNMKRSPLCGRDFEYYSEDPYLAGMLGASFVNGVQSVGVGTSVKHFCCNNQETRRLVSDSVVDDKALHEIYLSAFETVVKTAKPATVMCSYNRTNGEYVAESHYLLNDVLRKEWGFKGAVVSDWGACTDLTQSVKAGVSLEMPSSGDHHLRLLRKDLKKGIISEAEIRRANDDLARLSDEYGADNRTRKENYDISGNHDIAVKAATESAVLLKNDGILPLETRKIVIIGDLAEHSRFQGGGSSHINSVHVVSPLDAFRKAGYEVTYARGYSADRETIDGKLEEGALDILKEGSLVLFFGGLTDQSEGEGYDRKDDSMPANQIHLLKRIYDVTDNVVFISFGGAPYDMEPLQKSRAILQMYLCGEGVGEATETLVSGKVNPSGKLAESIPFSPQDVPSGKTFGRETNDVLYKESVFIGYRYYDTFQVPVRYSFGYGLSYTTFAYSLLSVSREGPNSFRVRFHVKNTGTRDGAEISQLYIVASRSDYLHPARELKGFTKTFLRTGEEKEIEILLPEAAFREYDRDRGWIVPEDEVGIEISSSLTDTQLRGSVHVDGIRDDLGENVKYPAYFDRKRKLQDITDDEFRVLYGKQIPSFDHTERGTFSMKNTLMDCSRYSLTARNTLAWARRSILRRNKGKSKDDSDVKMAFAAIEEGNLDIVCLQCGVPYHVGESIVLSCNRKHFRAFLKLVFR